MAEEKKTYTRYMLSIMDLDDYVSSGTIIFTSKREAVRFMKLLKSQNEMRIGMHLVRDVCKPIDLYSDEVDLYDETSI